MLPPLTHNHPFHRSICNNLYSNFFLLLIIMSSEKPIQSRSNDSKETWETTAQWAKAEASTLELSDEVEVNARREAEAAKQAAAAALVCVSPSLVHRSLLSIQCCLVLITDFSFASISPLAQPTRPPKRPKRSIISNAMRV